MRLAVIADIHGNYPALEAVLEDINQQDVDEIIVAGDAINGGPCTREVLDTIYERNLRMVIGNHEEYLLQTRDDATDMPPEWGTSYWTVAGMTKADFDFIESLPTQITVKNMAIYHASPVNIARSIFPNSSDEEIAALFGDVSEDIIITAHTHLPLVRYWRDKTIINPGSVGMSLDGNPMPSYVILTWIESRFIIQHRRVQYDLDAIIDAFEQSGVLSSPQQQFAKVFKRQMTEGQSVVTPFAHQALALEKKGMPLVEAINTIDVSAVQPKLGYWMD